MTNLKPVRTNPATPALEYFSHALDEQAQGDFRWSSHIQTVFTDRALYVIYTGRKVNKDETLTVTRIKYSNITSFSPEFHTHPQTPDTHNLQINHQPAQQLTLTGRKENILEALTILAKYAASDLLPDQDKE